MYFHPHSVEIRYSLGLVAYQLSLAQPRSVHLVTESAEMATAAVRQFGQVTYIVRVDNKHIQQAIQETLGWNTLLEADCGIPADMGIYPFTPVAQVAQAREETVAVACENAISYKSLLYPGRVLKTVFNYLDALKPNYSVAPAASLFTPAFVILWLLAKMSERLDSALYFQLEDYAMRRLVGYGPMWRFSYLVVFVGHKNR